MQGERNHACSSAWPKHARVGIKQAHLHPAHAVHAALPGLRRFIHEHEARARPQPAADHLCNHLREAEWISHTCQHAQAGRDSEYGALTSTLASAVVSQ